MCGIAGILHFDDAPVAPDLLRRMAVRLKVPIRSRFTWLLRMPIPSSRSRRRPWFRSTPQASSADSTGGLAGSMNGTSRPGVRSDVVDLYRSYFSRAAAPVKSSPAKCPKPPLSLSDIKLVRGVESDKIRGKRPQPWGAEAHMWMST